MLILLMTCLVFLFCFLSLSISSHGSGVLQICSPLFSELLVYRILFHLTTSHHCVLVLLFVLCPCPVCKAIELNASVARLWGPSSVLLSVDLSQPFRGQGSTLPTCFPEAFPCSDYEVKKLFSWV